MAGHPEKMVEYTMEEVKKHCTETDGWLVIKGKVYDVTGFVHEHPGGDVIMEGLGRNATDMFEDVGHGQGAMDELELWQIGTLKKD